MNSVLWLVVLATGLFVAVRSSNWAVSHLTEWAGATRIPPFIVGITVVSLGTDLPEIATSVIASISGHGDVAVGDSVGSATVQATLVLGLLPFIAGAFPISVGSVVRIGVPTVVALVAGTLMMLDGELSRLDASVLLVGWLVGTLISWRARPSDTRLPRPERRPAHRRHLLPAALGLALVGAGATTAIQAITQLAEAWSLPEYFIAFVLASAGTSLPELVVEVAAVRRREWDLAVGDALGSSFIDSTLSLAIGPVLAPIAVSTGVVVSGSLAAAGAISLTVLVLTRRRRHDRISGVLLIAVFLAVYLLVGALDYH